MDIFDILLPPLYLMLVLAIAYKYSRNKLRSNPSYRFFLPGLIAKIGGAIALGMVYYYYYKGGDTINYYQTAATLVDVLFDRPDDFMYLYFGKPHVSEYYLMNTAYDCTYWVKDEYAFFVAKCFVPVVLICAKSYMASAIIVATICYLPVWRLFIVFIREFPGIEKQFAWCILFVPSVVFWGSGLMKDSVTLAAACLYVHGFYWFFTQRLFRAKYLLALLAGAYFLISIKPYILFALLPGSTLWFVTLRIMKLKSRFIKFILMPVLLAGGLLLGVLLLQYIGNLLGAYSVEKILGKAATSQQDLKQSYYGGNTFDIGDYEPTIPGMLSVSHKAIFATLFRPTIFDVRNIVMFLSALENTFILLFTIYLVVKLRFFRFFALITSHPLVMFSFIFSLFFAFSVGVSISNFGTLVRLKIPCIPFFLSSLVILNQSVNLRAREATLAMVDFDKMKAVS